MWNRSVITLMKCNCNVGWWVVLLTYWAFYHNVLVMKTMKWIVENWSDCHFCMYVNRCCTASILILYHICRLWIAAIYYSKVYINSLVDCCASCLTVVVIPPVCMFPVALLSCGILRRRVELRWCRWYCWSHKPEFSIWNTIFTQDIR